MVDISAISGVIQSLNAMRQISQAMLDIRDSAMMQGKAAELSKVAFEALERAFESQAAAAQLQEEKRALEAKLREFETWTAEKQRYELKEIGTGAFAYVVKDAMRGAEPVHWLCANCFQQGKASILQITGMRGPFGDTQIWGCHACNAAIWIKPK